MTTDEARIMGEVIGRLAGLENRATAVENCMDRIENRLDRMEGKVDRMMWWGLGLAGTMIVLLVISLVRQGSL